MQSVLDSSQKSNYPEISRGNPKEVGGQEASSKTSWTSVLESGGSYEGNMNTEK